MSRQGSYKFIFVPKKLTFRDNAFIVQYNKITFTKLKSGLFFDDKLQYFLYLKKETTFTICSSCRERHLFNNYTNTPDRFQ